MNIFERNQKSMGCCGQQASSTIFLEILAMLQEDTFLHPNLIPAVTGTRLKFFKQKRKIGLHYTHTTNLA